MSMSREKVAYYIKKGDFDIFSKVDETQYAAVANHVADCFKREFFLSDEPEKWIAFMRHLNTNPPRCLKMPDCMITIFKKATKYREQHSKVADDRYEKLLMMILVELKQSEYFSLSGNQLDLLGAQLLNSKSATKLHQGVLKSIEKMTPEDQKKAFGFLLDLYIASPKLLYEAYRIRPHKNILNELVATTNDETKLWYLKQVGEMFKKNITELSAIVRYLSDVNSDMSFKNMDQKEKNTLLQLKRISTQSEKVLDIYTELFNSQEKYKEAASTLKELRKSSNEEAILDFTNKMGRYVSGFNKLGYDDALLTAAQTASRKKIKHEVDYNPVILMEGQFSDFLKVAHKANLPFRKAFIMTGVHWIAGELEMDKDGFVRVAIIDSLGAYAGGRTGIFSDTLVAMHFINTIFPEAVIYFSEDKLQHGIVECSVFAQTAAVRNFEQNVEKSLFEYFADQNKPLTVAKPGGLLVPFYRCNLPLAFMRTAQTESYVKAVAEGRLPNVKVSNKENKGDFLSATDRFFVPKPKGEPGRRNTRLKHELIKMGLKGAVYYFTHDKKTREKDAEQFKVSAFEQECAKKSASDNEEDDNPLLHRAIRMGNVNEVVRLLKMGDDPYLKNPRGRTAMDFAFNAWKLDKVIASHLLMKAVQAGDYKTAEKLLEKGADPNEVSLYEAYKEYPLHRAVQIDKAPLLAKLLIDKGADPELENKNGHLVEEVAFEKALRNKDWSSVIRLLPCDDSKLVFTDDYNELLVKKLPEILPMFVAMINETQDSKEKVRMLKLASDQSTILGSILVNDERDSVQGFKGYIDIMLTMQDTVSEKAVPTAPSLPRKE